MNKTIKIKRGLKANLPAAGVVAGELKFTTDTKELFIGDGTTNIRLSSTIIETTYAALKTLRDAGGLTPGQQYRITDFVTTTTQPNTQSAGHAFDLVVVADSVDKLNEQARAIQHDGDTYFANSKLEAWQVWYSLDNDTNRFAWADEENGKGVIYRMIDEWNNDVPYDFKNIQYQTRPGFAYNQWGQDYTFNRNVDLDMMIDDVQYYGFVGDRTPSAWSDNKCWVTDNPVQGNSTLYAQDGSVISYGGTKSNISTESYDAYTFSKTKVTADNFDVSLNGFLYSCYNNTIRPYVIIQANKYQVLNRITFIGWYTATSYPGLHCYSNTFGNNCYNNTFGNRCSSNAFGNNVSYNKFGNAVFRNSFGNDVSSNTFDYDVSNNSFGNNVYSNTFGNDVGYNSFGNSVSYNTFGDYFWYNTVENDVRYVSTPDTTYPDRFQYVTLENGLLGASSINLLNLDGIKEDVGNDTPIKVARGTGTEIVAVWQDSAGDTNGKYKINNLDNVWKTIPQEIEGGTF